VLEGDPSRVKTWKIVKSNIERGSEMEKKKFAQVTVLVLLAGLIGYLIGPPIAQAAASLVTIKDPKTLSKARVVKGNLWTDASGSFVFTEPGGETVLVSGSSNVTKSGVGDIVGISLDVPDTGGSPVTLTVRKGNVSGSGVVIWQGTITGTDGHFDSPFNQSIFLTTGFNTVVTTGGSATLQYEIYGAGFGVPFKDQKRSAKVGG
jgi:hypothetical protein